MHLINLFLQKRKMHENQHGLLMIATAYVLSALMLILGSDMFYNINSLAAGVRTETYEETQEVSKEEAAITPEVKLMLGQTQADPIGPYGLIEAAGTGLGTLNLPAEVDTGTSLWFLGCATSQDDFERLLETMTIKNRLNLSGQSEEVESSEVKAVASNQKEKDASKVKTSSKSKSKNEKDNSKEEISSFAAKEENNPTVLPVTKKEVTMLERIVEAEATGEDITGKILVANVIFNRIASDEFPDTVEKVIFQNDNGDYQFSPVEDERYWSVKISDESKEAVKRALEGEDYSKGALYFISKKRTNSSSAKWFDQNLDWLFKHGGHEFYK